jgi:phage antirepressor YoqD-like protein
MFELSLPQAKQVLVRESKHVRKKVIAYIEALENELKKRRIPQSYGEALLEAGRLAIENEKLKLEHKELEKTLELQKPKVMFADAIETAPTSILVSELAKLINQSGIEIGGNRLFEWMRENGYLIKRKGSDHNMPTQKAINLNLFEIKEGTRLSADGSIKITKTTKVTGKGQIYFINKFKKWNIIN